MCLEYSYDYIFLLSLTKILKNMYVVAEFWTPDLLRFRHIRLSLLYVVEKHQIKAKISSWLLKTQMP